MYITSYFGTNKQFGLIYADPPWSFTTHSSKGKKKSADMHYNCMSLEDIKAMPVSELALPDCYLFMWTTDPFLQKAFEVIDSWGFEYKTVGFYWAKQNRVGDGFFMGTGYHTRANPEQCLLATIGRPKRVSASVPKLIVSRVREHSRKPEEAYSRLEELVGPVPKIELFARTTRPGWSSWGNETEKFAEAA